MHAHAYIYSIGTGMCIIGAYKVIMWDKLIVNMIQCVLWRFVQDSAGKTFMRKDGLNLKQVALLALISLVSRDQKNEIWHFFFINIWKQIWHLFYFTLCFFFFFWTKRNIIADHMIFPLSRSDLHDFLIPQETGKMK